MKAIRRLAYLAASTALLPGLAAAQSVSISAPGAPDDVKDALRAASLVRTLKDEDTPTAEDYVAAAQADYRRLLTALYTQGYYGGEISIRVDGREASGIPPLAAPSNVNEIEITVETGPQFTFGTASVAPVPAGTVLPDGFRQGEPAASTVIEDAARTGITAWRQSGHAKADITGEAISADHAANRLDTSITITPGPVLTFGPLVVTSQSAVRRERIIEIAGLPEGRQFSPEEVDRAVARLRRTGTFASVVLREADEIGPNQTLPILAELQDDAPRRLGFGVELSSVDGLTLSGYWLHRNIFGGAERLRVDGEISGLEDGTEGGDLGFGVEFSRPATFNPDNELYINTGFFLVQDELLTFRALVAEIGLNRIVNDEFTTSWGVGLRTARTETETETVNYTLFTLPLSATLDRRNDEFDATSGYYIDLEATPFVGLDNVDNGARFYADGRYYRSFGTDARVTLATRLQFGSVVGPTGADAPQDFLFFSGGGGTVRGQDYQSLGIERDGIEAGGNSFLGAQLEARVRVTDNIEGVAFYDAGLVSRESFPVEGDPWHAGAGIGVRYKTGIGPIRLDLATPVSGGDNDTPDVQVYIGIGQAF